MNRPTDSSTRSPINRSAHGIAERLMRCLPGPRALWALPLLCLLLLVAAPVLRLAWEGWCCQQGGHRAQATGCPISR